VDRHDDCRDVGGFWEGSCAVRTFGVATIAVVALATSSVLLSAAAVRADTLAFGLDIPFSGANQPAGTAPWITATFDDSFGDANTVRLTLSASNLVSEESVSSWHFNFDPGLVPTLLTFTVVDNSAAVPNAINKGVDSFLANGDGMYDILFDLPPPSGAFPARFTTGETIIYDIGYISPITVASFDFLSAVGGGQGEFISAAHIESIGPSGDGSGWIGYVPEPSSALLFASGLIGLALNRGRRRA
jgi:hypothetical protein